MPTTVLLTGESGLRYEYQVLPLDASWNETIGCYAYAITMYGNPSVTRLVHLGNTESGRHEETESRERTRMSAKNLGANVVLTRFIPDEDERLAEEQDLLRYYRPRLNH